MGIEPKRGAGSLADRLITWYEQERRDLPWRHTRDPYAVWISEVMLQQTRVDAVKGRWERFLARFPDLRSLAAAPIEAVLAEWAGLGYYRRARQLHEAARRVVEQHGGRLPSDPGRLGELPGMGAYTAGAVASIAFDEAVPAVDGNVLRVFGRFFAFTEDPRRGEAARSIRETIAFLHRRAAPSVVNQALMELGATVCVPRAPHCSWCPWSQECRARELGRPEDFPPPRRRPRTVEVSAYAAVQPVDGRYLFRLRGEGGHNQGLWEFPTVPWHEGRPRPARARSGLGDLAGRLGTSWTLAEMLGTIRHTITRHRITVEIWRVEGPLPAESASLRWRTLDEAPELGLTAAADRVRRFLLDRR